MKNEQNEYLLDYLDILELTYAVVNVLKGKKTEIPKMPSCQKLAIKIFFHAATIYYLRQGTKIPSFIVDIDFIDFASVTALTRVTIENYLRLYEIFFMPTNDDERIFRHALWELQGFTIREKIVPLFITAEEKEEKIREIDEIRAEISKTTFFKSLNNKEQKQILKGIRPKKFGWRQIAKAAGINSKTFLNYFEFLHSYVHSDGLSGAQIIYAETRKKQEELMNGCILIITAILAKMIMNYHDTFHESQVVCNNNPESFEKAIIHAKVLERIP